MDNWEDLEERFRSKVRVGGPGECWVWTGRWQTHGYGRYSVGYEMMGAHRYVFERMVGPIPSGMYVTHVCDRPSCVNVAHLRLGTQLDNMRDCAQKNRIARGGKLPQTKLQREQVAMIRRIHEEMEVTHTHLARLYGVTRAAITSVIGRTNWSHVP